MSEFVVMVLAFGAVAGLAVLGLIISLKASNTPETSGRDPSNEGSGPPDGMIEDSNSAPSEAPKEPTPDPPVSSGYDNRDHFDD